MELPPCPLKTRWRVAFDQTDAAGLMHFSTYLQFMERAEADLFRSLEHPLLWEDEGQARGFPRVDCQCRFRLPVYFDEWVETRLTIEALQAGRIEYAYVFFREDGRRCATGRMTTACAVRDGEGKLQGTSLPEDLRSALHAWKSQSA
jgi:YbgC/YbaW family acyl-CoA thioester hydrolase